MFGGDMIEVVHIGHPATDRLASDRETIAHRPYIIYMHRFQWLVQKLELFMGP